MTINSNLLLFTFDVFGYNSTLSLRVGIRVFGGLVKSSPYYTAWKIRRHLHTLKAAHSHSTELEIVLDAERITIQMWTTRKKAI